MQIDLAPGASQPSADTLAAVASAPQQVMSAWGNEDAHAFAATFTENGSMILPGFEVQGRDKIAEFMAGAFAGPYKDTQVVGAPVRLTVLSGDAVLMITEGGVRSKTATELQESEKVRASWLLVRDDGAWRLAAYQNTTKNGPSA